MNKKIKLLIVDDDDNTRSMYAEIFQGAGFEVSEAIDGVDGLDKATKNPPEVIFTGIIMPRMDGFGLIEALKKNVSTSNIPVVISSHMGREEDQKKARELGVRDFIIVGYYTPREIVDRIKSLFAENEYKLKIIPNELDAKRMAMDTGMNEDFKCTECGKDLIIVVQPLDIRNHLFSAKFVCSSCKKVN